MAAICRAAGALLGKGLSPLSVSFGLCFIWNYSACFPDLFKFVVAGLPSLRRSCASSAYRIAYYVTVMILRVYVM